MKRTASRFAHARAPAVDRPLAAGIGRASGASVPALVAGLCLIPFSCLADRPLVSETADVIDRDACQVEAAASHSRASGAPKVREWSGVITCGTAFDTQPALTYSSSRVAGEKEEVLLLGAKTTLQMPEHGRPGYGIAYSVGGVKLPGTSWRREEFNVTGLFTGVVGKGLSVNAAYATRFDSPRVNQLSVGAKLVF